MRKRRRGKRGVGREWRRGLHIIAVHAGVGHPSLMPTASTGVQGLASVFKVFHRCRYIATSCLYNPQSLLRVSHSAPLQHLLGSHCRLHVLMLCGGCWRAVVANYGCWWAWWAIVVLGGGCELLLVLVGCCGGSSLLIVCPGHVVVPCCSQVVVVLCYCAVSLLLGCSHCAMLFLSGCGCPVCPARWVGR